MIEGLYANKLADELSRLVNDRPGWTATLFRQSSIGLMEELAVAGTQVANGILSGSSFDDLKSQVYSQILTDPGLGSMQARGPMLAQIPRDSKEFVSSSFKHKAWVFSIPKFRENYINCWRNELVSEKYQDAQAPLFKGAVPPYDAACFLASHLLQLGISRSYWARWLDYRMLHDPQNYTLDDLLREIEEIYTKGPGLFRIMVALARPPQEDIRSLRNWLPAKSVREWLSEQSLDGPRRLHGGILYETEQWDLDSALMNVAMAVHRLRQRLLLKTGRAPEFHGKAWIKGVRASRVLPNVSQIGRALVPGYEFGDDAQAEAAASENRLEVAIDLLQAVLSEPGPGTTGILWAALEGLLAAPGDPDKIQVCKRAADISLVALVRTSMQVSIGTLVSRCPDEAVSQRIRRLGQSGGLAEFEQSIRRGDHDTITHRSTRVMLSHARSLLDADVLRAKRIELEQTFRGLYRQRNLILHGGITDAPLLHSIFRSSAPLVTAVVNRYARAIQDGMRDPHLFAYDIRDPHLFAYDMYTKIEGYLNDPKSATESFW